MSLKEKLLNIGNKFTKISTNLLAIFVAIILFVLAICAICFTAKFANASWNQYSELVVNVKDNIFLNIFLIVLFLVFLYFINKIISKINKKILLIIALIIVAVVGIFWVNYLKVLVKADQKQIYNIAIQFLSGEYSTLDSANYLFNHPLQLGILYFVMIIYKIINYQSPLVFQNINIIFAIVCTLFLYKICKILYKNEKSNKLILIMLPMFIVLPILSTLVYGNIVGLMFALISMYLILKYLEKRKPLNLIIGSILIVISIVLKENYQIFLIAIVIILLLDLIKNWKKFNIIGIVLMCGLTLISNSLIYKITETITGKEVNEGIPMLTYIAMGMAESSDRAAGWYNVAFNVESVYSENNYDTEKTIEASKEKILERIQYFIQNPKDFVKYYKDKILTTWIEPTFQSIWLSEPLDEYEQNAEYQEYVESNKLISSIFEGNISKLIIKYLDIYQIIIYIFSFIYIISSIKNKEFDEKNILLILIFFGGFLFHILWETKSLYAMPYFYMLIPIAVMGIVKTFNIIDNKILEIRK